MGRAISRRVSGRSTLITTAAGGCLLGIPSEDGRPGLCIPLSRGEERRRSGRPAVGPRTGNLLGVGSTLTSSLKAWLWNRIVVFAIPRQAIKRRERGSVVLNVTRATIQAKWRVRVLPHQAA